VKQPWIVSRIHSVYGATNFSLVVGATVPDLESLIVSPNHLVFVGVAGSNYIVLTSTNLALPLTSWTPLVTNTFGSTGAFSFTNTPPWENPGVFTGSSTFIVGKTRAEGTTGN
jgi:hypothetical protein